VRGVQLADQVAEGGQGVVVVVHRGLGAAVLFRGAIAVQRRLLEQVGAAAFHDARQAARQAYGQKLRHYADLRIKLDLDDGVKVNYGKFGDLLAEVKAVCGTKEEA
jgi:hypothetical protein